MRELATMVLCLIALASQGIDGGAKPGSGVAHGHIVMRQRVHNLTGNEEIGEWTLMRWKGDMTSQDSLDWLRSMTPGTEIVWVNRKCKGLELQVDLPTPFDTLIADVIKDTTVVRSFGMILPDVHGVCRFKWDLKSAAKRQVEPGVYELGLGTGDITTEFFIVVGEAP